MKIQGKIVKRIIFKYGSAMVRVKYKGELSDYPIPGSVMELTSKHEGIDIMAHANKDIDAFKKKHKLTEAL